MTKRYNITDEQLREAVNNSTSMFGVLRFLGIKEAGGSVTHYKIELEKLALI